MTKLKMMSKEKIVNPLTIFNKQILKASNKLAVRYYNKGEYITWRFQRENNYKGDKIEDAKKANELFLKAIELNPKFEDAYNRYAQNLRITLNEYNVAIEVYTKLIELNPKYEYAIIRRGFCKEALKDYQGYLEDFNKSISINGGTMEIGDYISRSIIKRTLKDFDGVIYDLLEAKKLGELNAFDYEKLGQAFVEVGDLEKSFEFFEKAIEIELRIKDENKIKVTFPLLFRVFDTYTNALIQIENFEKASEIVGQMQLHYPNILRTKELSELINSIIKNRANEDLKNRNK